MRRKGVVLAAAVALFCSAFLSMSAWGALGMTQGATEVASQAAPLDEQVDGVEFCTLSSAAASFDGPGAPLLTIEGDFGLCAGINVMVGEDGGNFAEANIVDQSDSSVTVVLPSGDPGTRRVIVDCILEPESGCSCDDGKPSDLLFRYTGDNCESSVNSQGSAFECAGDPAFASPVTLQFPEYDATADPFSVDLDGYVLVSSTGSKLDSNTEIDVVGGAETQSMRIHTSCSKPLEPGDTFGSLQLIGLIPEGGIAECGPPISGSCSIDVAVGTQGPQGEQGKIGPQGEPGEQGVPGMQGVQGKVGPQGDKGATGDSGPQGEQGVPGMQGVQGKIGPQGDKGATGDTGPQGEQGVPGMQGVQGKIGPQGDKGATGDTGPQGEQGVPGMQGVQGKIGPQGDKGATGDTGPQGEQGVPGMQGVQGKIGPQGDKGATGDTGPQGEQGVPGMQGVQGKIGPQGDKGETGDTGPQGEQGVPGMQGVQGKIGPQGDKGETGDTGPEGPAFTPDYGEGYVLVDRGGGPVPWAAYSATLGDAPPTAFATPHFDSAGGAFRFTCTPAQEPCRVSLAAFVVGGGTADVVPRILIHRQDYATAGPSVYCEFGDQASNTMVTQPALGPLTFGVGGSLDCAPAVPSLGLPAYPTGQVLSDPMTELWVPQGYYDVWATFVFTNYVP